MFGCDVFVKVIMSEDYIVKFILLVEMVEDMESLGDLYYFCNIMKMVVLLNDIGFIEYVVFDECVLGVVGVMEYDFDFLMYKVNYW